MTALRSSLRQPDITRGRLLDCAYTEFHQRGFRAASLDSILVKAGVTKGALLDGVRLEGGFVHTHTLVMNSATRTVREVRMKRRVRSEARGGPMHEPV